MPLILKVLDLNVYLPCDNQDYNSLYQYSFYINKINLIIDEYEIINLIISRDINAGPFKGRFWK